MAKKNTYSPVYSATVSAQQGFIQVSIGETAGTLRPEAKTSLERAIRRMFEEDQRVTATRYQPGKPVELYRITVERIDAHEDNSQSP